jgi:hypothetical protein
MLCESGVSVCRDGQSIERLVAMRVLYEGYAQAISNYLLMPLPPWIADQPHKDNWLAVAKLRAKTEEANPVDEESRTASPLDHSHDF